MRDLSEFLDEREIYVLKNCPQKTYKAIGEELGVSGGRIRQIKDYALRKIRKEKGREQRTEICPVTLQRPVLRKELWVILRALEMYNQKLYAQFANEYVPRAVETDPDYLASQALIEEIRELLKRDPAQKTDTRNEDECQNGDISQI